MSLLYREGTVADKHQLIELSIEAYKEFAIYIAPEHWIIFDRNLRDEKKLLEVMNKAKTFVCMDQDKIVGMACLIPHGNPWDIFEADWSYIRMVGVNPAWRGK